MKRLSINELHELTDKDRRTIKKHLHVIEPDKDGRYNSALALQTLYVGDSGPTYSEAIRRLAITREEVERQKQIKLAVENAENAKMLLRVQTVVSFLEGSYIAIRERILGSHLSRTEQEDILRQLVAIQDTPVHKLGRKALWEEFKAGGLADQGKLSEVDTASMVDGATDGNGAG